MKELFIFVTSALIGSGLAIVCFNRGQRKAN